MLLKRTLVLSTIGIAALSATAVFADKLKMTTVAPGSSAYLVASTMASTANLNQDAHRILVDASSNIADSLIATARGEADFAVSSLPMMVDMGASEGAFEGNDEAAVLRQNLSLLFWFPKGPMHAATKANSSIERLADIRGRKVYLGPEGSEDRDVASAWVNAITGYVEGQDYDVVEASWGQGLRLFKDGDVDVYLSAGLTPFPRIEDASQASQIRLLGLTRAEADAGLANIAELQNLVNAQGRSIGSVAAGIYGNGVVNTDDVFAVADTMGLMARGDLSEDVVYEVVKAFWEGLPNALEANPFMKEINADTALTLSGVRLHPGALRYYSEAGWNIPGGLR